MPTATCQWLIDPDDPDKKVCGQPATVTVTVKTKITQARVELCSVHKKEHDVSFAHIRTERKAAAQKDHYVAK